MRVLIWNIQNRLKVAYYQLPGTAIPHAGSFDAEYAYDLNCNILHLKRNGENDDPVNVFAIDDLNYAYDLGNRLKAVRDNEQDSRGYNDRHTSANIDDFEYDDFGNMTKNRDRQIGSITYNHLNLPAKITFDGGETLEYTYLADGRKMAKLAEDALGNSTHTEYRDGFQYKDNVLEFLSHSEGYAKAVPQTLAPNPEYDFHYVYTYADHLGNIRLKYTAHPQTGDLEILEEDHYYPYGLTHKGYNGNHQIIGWGQPGTEITLIPVTPGVTDPYKYKFGGMEYQDEFDVNLYDFGARNYDPALGRWMNIDPLAELMRRHSPYNYAFNNPVYFIDPDGMMPGGFANTNMTTSTGAFDSIGGSNGFDVRTEDKDGNTLDFISVGRDQGVDIHADGNLEKNNFKTPEDIGSSNSSGNYIKGLFNKVFSYTNTYNKDNPLIIEDNLLENVSEEVSNPLDEAILEYAQAAAIGGSGWKLNKPASAIAAVLSIHIPSPSSNAIVEYEIREVTKWYGSVTYNMLSREILSVNTHSVMTERQIHLKSVVTQSMGISRKKTFSTGGHSSIPVIGEKMK